jgi:DNA-binding transcriptional regulator LsrR (DeoR family)
VSIGQTHGRSADLDLLGKTARLYYDYGLTHQEVAEILKLSRVKVTRLLQQARQAGIVEIKVRTEASPYAASEATVAHAFGLDEAVVVPSFDDEFQLRASIARGVATYLQRILRSDMTVAIALSRTIAAVPNFIIDPRPTRASFVSLVGGLRHAPDAVNPYESTERLAQLFGGRAEHLHAPVVVGSREIARALMRDPAISRSLGKAADANAALVGLGGLKDHLNLVSEGALTAKEWNELIAAGAVGDIGARYFDIDGRPVKHELNRRIIGLTLEQLRRIPLRVVAAGGRDKDKAVHAALRRGLISVLVTDAGTAERVLALDTKRSTRSTSPLTPTRANRARPTAR